MINSLLIIILKFLKHSSLEEVYQKFIMDIENLKVFWDEIQSIDENCWVLEPSNPSLADNKRRINLSRKI